MFYGKETNPFYKSAAWRKARKLALQRDSFLCQDCVAAKKRGEMIRARAATVVHHIKPIDKNPNDRLALDNLISLCDACHNKRHPEKGTTGTDKATCVRPGVTIIKV